MKEYNTDKFKSGLIDIYHKIIGEKINRPINLMEIGTYKSGFLDYCSNEWLHPKSKIIGVDINPKDLRLKNVKMYKCNQNDKETLHKIAEIYGKFDIIIDDASHELWAMYRTFCYMYEYVKTGGWYIIEDLAKDNISIRVYDMILSDLIRSGNCAVKDKDVFFINNHPKNSILFIRKE